MTPNEARPLRFNELQRRISACARDQRIPVDLLHHRVATDVIFGILDEATAREIIDSYAVKGGVGLDIRFGLRARSTRDVDLIFPVPFEAIPSLVAAIFSLEFRNFRLCLKDHLKPMERVQTYRADVEVSYLGKSFARLILDINASRFAAVDIIPSELLANLGLGSSVNAHIIDVHSQLAHKIHGATQPSTLEYRNDRFRDVIDALILADADLDFERARTTCRAEFSQRSTHVWPPTIELDDRWRAGLSSRGCENHGVYAKSR